MAPVVTAGGRTGTDLPDLQLNRNPAGTPGGCVGPMWMVVAPLGSAVAAGVG